MHRAIVAVVAVVVTATLATLTPSAFARRKAGPAGTFRNTAGVVKLAYLGEGSVSVELKTKYCQLSVTGSGKAQANTFVPNEGIAVHDAAGKPVLVIFYAGKKIVVWAGFERFKRHHCRGGLDATGVYRRKR